MESVEFKLQTRMSLAQLGGPMRACAAAATTTMARCRSTTGAVTSPNSRPPARQRAPHSGKLASLRATSTSPKSTHPARLSKSWSAKRSGFSLGALPEIFNSEPTPLHVVIVELADGVRIALSIVGEVKSLDTPAELVVLAYHDGPLFAARAGTASAVLHAISNIKTCLLGHGGVANPRDATGIAVVCALP